MKTNFLKLALVAVVTMATFTFTSCKDNGEDSSDDSKAAAVAEQFVDNTVAPTYTALASAAEELADQLAALKNSSNPTQSALQAACDKFLEAREWWEKSEAFLFGAAADYGIDPHIDSWPLDEDNFNTLMNSPNMLAALDGNVGDVVAGENLGNALLGFHGIEYILFENGVAKNVSSISDNEWIYVTAVAGDLRNRCFQLEVGWIGDDAPASHIEKLDDLEMQYTVASGELSYGENMKKAGQAGSTYGTRLAALMSIVQGCIDIADEVGSSKINAAFSGEDPTYIESPYSYMSITDFTNNIKSIQNVWMGGIEGQRDESKSLNKYVGDIDNALATAVVAKIDNALAKIGAMPAPFALNYSNAANGDAVEACTELSEILDEVVEALRKL
mgnify:CR=1 FL=1